MLQATTSHSTPNNTVANGMCNLLGRAATSTQKVEANAEPPAAKIVDAATGQPRAAMTCF